MAFQELKRGSYKTCDQFLRGLSYLVFSDMSERHNEAVYGSTKRNWWLDPTATNGTSIVGTVSKHTNK